MELEDPMVTDQDLKKEKEIADHPTEVEKADPRVTDQDLKKEKEETAVRRTEVEREADLLQEVLPQEEGRYEPFSIKIRNWVSRLLPRQEALNGRKMRPKKASHLPMMKRE